MKTIGRMPTTLLLLAAGVFFYAADAAATDPAECVEAAQFIGNAARARDAGMTREDFLAHVQADLEAIRAFPPQMRWFAETEQDEQFLLNAAREVFDQPSSPEAQARRFERACVTRADV